MGCPILYSFTRQTKAKSSRRGVAIVVVMLMLALVGSFTVAAGLLAQQNYTNAAHREKMLKAEYAYKAGLATALERLAEDPTWAPTQASPMVVTLVPEEKIGFKLWLDGLNRSASTPVTSASGVSLGKGQAAVKVVPTIDGEDILSGFGAFEQTPILMQPQVRFDANVISPDLSEGLHLGYYNSKTSPAYLVSYDSNNAIAEWDGATLPIPAANQHASVRCATDFNLQWVTLMGQAILPSKASFYPYESGSALGTVFDDTSVDAPRFANPFPAAPLQTITGGSQHLQPGSYDDSYLNNGEKITLERGKTYYFDYLELGNNCELSLVGPLSDGPCVIYTHGFVTKDNNLINMPTSGTPRAKDLQFYMTPLADCAGSGVKGCDSMGLVLGYGTKAAFVEAGTNVTVTLQNNARLYGSTYGRCGYAMGPGSVVHYDEALKTIEPEGQSQWVLVSQGHK